MRPGLLAVLLVLVSLGPAPPGRDRLNQPDKSLVTRVAPECESLVCYEISPHGNRVLYYGRLRTGKTGIWENSRLLVCCDEVLEFGYTTAGNRYAAYRSEDRFYVMFGDKTSRGFDAIIPDDTRNSYLTFSPDGRRVAFRVRDGVWMRAVCDFRLGAPYTTVSFPLFDHSGRNLYHLAQQGNGWMLVTNGRPGRVYDAADELTLLPCTQQPLFRARCRDRYKIVTGNQEGPLLSEILELTFTYQDSLPAYIARDSNQWLIVEDTAVRLKPNALLVHTLRYRPSARPDVFPHGEPVYVVMDGMLRMQLMTGDSPVSDRHENISRVTVSPDGSRLVYSAQDQQTNAVYCNGRRQPVSGIVISPIIFSPDSRHYACIIEDTASHSHSVFLDSTLSNSYDEVAELRFNPVTSELVAVVRQDENWFVVVDRQPGMHFDGIGSIYFSPHSGKLAYLAIKGDSACHVIAGRQGRVYEDVGGLQFSPDGKRVSYGARLNNCFYWIREDVP